MSSSQRSRQVLGLELELERNLEAPAIARAAASGLCHELDLSGSLCQTLLLLVSEVVTNAVIHSTGPPKAPIHLSASVSSEVVFVAVTDAGQGFKPKPRDPGHAGGGYGLYLVEKAARRWGVDTVGGARVWFELPRSG